MDRYRILCSVHGYQYVWSDTLVTTCPVDSNDSVNQDMTCIDGQLRMGGQFSPNITSVSLSRPMRIASIFYDMRNMGSLKRVGIYSYCDPGVTSYTVELYNKTNLETLASGTFSNTNDYDMNYINNIPDTTNLKMMLEIYVSVNSPTSKKSAYISQIILYGF